MPRIRVGLLIILVAMGLPGLVMAKSSPSMSRWKQIFGDVDNLCADEQGPWLTAGEVFAADILPEISFFDRPVQSYICVEWISIAEILDDTAAQSCPFVVTNPEGLEEVSFALLEPRESSARALFVIASPCELMIGYYKMPLVIAEVWKTIGL